MQSKILSIGIALIPAAILVCAHSSLGEAKGDECKDKPDGVSPAGLHWYYRVDRANNRHCWYLHTQGMPVRSRIDTASRSLDVQNDAAGEQVWKTPPITRTPQPQYEQSETTADEPAGDFADRWVDLPKSVDLNAHAFVAESNGYAAERAVDNKQEQLPPTLTNVSASQRRRTAERRLSDELRINQSGRCGGPGIVVDFGSVGVGCARIRLEFAAP